MDQRHYGVGLYDPDGPSPTITSCTGEWGIFQANDSPFYQPDDFLFVYRDAAMAPTAINVHVEPMLVANCPTERALVCSTLVVAP